ncbi:polyprenyl synthetase family protein [Corynebacterium mendelii]|uniref:Polyprenyl synthetase family protein n=1 Tax=Corynebacterium mendelii TaxID=2765362 RepID=A0A939E147_9CORY|nr:polyprenyl synthetase family protein [Corynebacterium mendelii]MBN9643908.1 polyprenyl synthetase family protein [Corynebacterium mendelii]
MSNGRPRPGRRDPDVHGPDRPSIGFDDPALQQAVTAGIDAVEELIIAEISGGKDFITDKVRHLVHAGGKRFRPMFAMLASQFGDNPCCEEVVQAAVVVELTHLATLYHDDVMDEADKRRGVVSANARWNNSVAILAGDYLLSCCSRIMARLGKPTVEHFAHTFGELVTGQMRETIGPGDGDTIEHYMNVIREKTGVLIGSAGYLGALHSGADERTVDALQKLGMEIGIVFQIVDDIIDIWSDTEQSGKVPGTDLKEGVFTLPVLYALADESPAGDALRATLTGPVADEDVDEVLALIKQTNGRDKALEVVRSAMAEATNQLDRLPDLPAKQALQSVMAYTVSRVG